MYLSGTGQGIIMGSCEHGDERSGCIQCESCLVFAKELLTSQ